MFKKILIANRGEIALRVIRACRELGIETVAVYSEADVDSMHVQLADEAICIGTGMSNQSYLKIDRIISSAEISGVDAIHPGYGFLSENPDFAEICESCHVKFIGPPSKIIQKMGDKAEARKIVSGLNLPVIPGSKDIVNDMEEAKQIARDIGYPVLVKASAGGGGKGMRLSYSEDEFVSNFITAQTEAKNAFGNPDCYIEKFIENPSHIEFQIVADSQGNVVHLGERDCSIQRRNQKMIEECPSPKITPEKRKEMGEVARQIAEQIGYENCGTIEFIMDKDGNFYFIEMNTRIQVEHPVTEEVYGCDLIKEQINVAAGLPISKHLLSPHSWEHSIECRINAEDPANNFMPSPGKIKLFYTPGGRGVRVDTHVYAGYTIPPYYDSMIAKLIVVGSDRESALARMNRALREFHVDGVKTTIPFLIEILNSKDFQSGVYDTSYVGKVLS